MKFNTEKAGKLAVEWGVPAAIGLAVLAGCEIQAYKNDGKSAETLAAEAAEKEKRPTLTAAIAQIVKPALGM